MSPKCWRERITVTLWRISWRSDTNMSAPHWSRNTTIEKRMAGAFATHLLMTMAILSKADNRYVDLQIMPFSPLAMIFVTTQEVPRTVKLMARTSGLVVLTSDDLCRLFCATVSNIPQPLTATWVRDKIRELCENLP